MCIRDRLGTAAQAQKINKEALLQKIEKNETASADAKKGAKAATWLNLDVYKRQA